MQEAIRKLNGDFNNQKEKEVELTLRLAAKDKQISELRSNAVEKKKILTLQKEVSEKQQELGHLNAKISLMENETLIGWVTRKV